MIRKLIRKILIGIGGFLGLLLLYVLAAIVFSYLPAKVSPLPSVDNSITMYVGSNGVHLDFFLPWESVPNDWKKTVGMPRRYQWVGIGWGEAAFFTSTPTWSDLTFSTAVKAALWPSPAALHFSYFRNPQSHWRPIKVNHDQLDTLLQYIVDFFEYNKSGKLIPMQGAGYPERDHFIAARKGYYFLYTCNNWVNEGLKEIEVPTSIWSPFDFGVLHHLDKMNTENQD
ncbi:MAG TPA: hypothetical protein DCE41_32905 [Cytophagales bacterium]|nr:hypothetical protein [Cytophagales bacterium]HAA17303.1 hypothetical protein [Cytophagales bacterium]HAP62965.1 hypothetical protein [Cytophagales bacterium]